MTTAPSDDRGVDATSEQLIAEALPAPVFIVQDQRFVYVNRAFAELVGLERADLIGTDSLDRVHPDDRDAVTEWLPSLDSGSRASSTMQLRLRRGDGTDRSVLVTMTRVVHGGRPALLGTVVDVTSHPEALAVPVRMAAVGRLAGGVAHDFNNLLFVIGGQVERLQHELPADHDLRAAVDAIGTAAERAALLTDQLLSFGRRQMLTPQETDLSAVVAEMESQLRSRLGGTIRLKLNRAATVPAIRVDRPRLVQVLRHLVDNARDAMPAGGTLTLSVDAIAVDAELTAQWPFLAGGGRFVRLRVEDTGIGIDPGVVAHIFEPFFTTKGRGRGSGMSLASVYGIVKQSRGFVFVERTSTDGTCVTVLLPSLADAQDAARPGGAAAADGALTRRPRILLVEDEMAVRELLVEMMSRSGFDVAAAGTGEQAVLMAADEPFDLLLTDINLPGMNGAQLVTALRDQFPRLPVVLMSGYPEDSVLGEARPDDRRVLLRKPFSRAQLVARLRETLAAADSGFSTFID
jgi:two-component system, cell cycle sensor histidine kinase and response regulator CckA